MVLLAPHGSASQTHATHQLMCVGPLFSLAHRVAAKIFVVSAMLGPTLCLAQGGPGGFAVQAALEDAARSLSESKPDQALTVLTPVEQVEPDNPWLWFYRGRAHDQLDSP
ncbi:MAG: hypothetical protein GY778_24040 [bacterium]|nr:hypothetical protein [bacterium]